ncbi:MAG: nucleoside triphosphate pyrophosphohydrolase [Deltaproteobacteria bacterium]|nr:nucleoside triphosphate pyrophosphohydrolase [Deltaproteobacteria bacterium]
MKGKNNLEELVELVRKLRGPDGCPWDREQKVSDLKSYLVGEVYEVLDAIDLNDSSKIKEESGDLFFLIVFLVDIFRERDDFNIYEMIGMVMDKMIRRHPHVFGDKRVKDTDEVKTNWRKIKEEEGKPAIGESILDGVHDFLPALFQAQLLTQKASRVGFDWQTEELKKSIEDKESKAIENELGDVFFSLVNLGRFMKMDSEKALRKTNKKFINRFHYIEKSLRDADRDIKQATLKEMDLLWEKAKECER